MVMPSFAMSCVGSSTCGLESSLEVALDDGPPRKGPKHVVVFFNNLKIQLCYDGHLYT
jgi:hypothetical protein